MKTKAKAQELVGVQNVLGSRTHAWTDSVALPETVDCAVGRIIEEMSGRERAMLAHLEDWQASLLGRLLVEYLRFRLSRFSVNQTLLQDCKTTTGKADVDEARAAEAIVVKVWSRLREDHQLCVDA